MPSRAKCHKNQELFILLQIIIWFCLGIPSIGSENIVRLLLIQREHIYNGVYKRRITSSNLDLVHGVSTAGFPHSTNKT